MQIFAVIVVVCIMPPIFSKNVTITTTFSNKQPVCPGDQVNFTCETRGSDIIAWISEEYINRGGTRVEFAAFDVGVTMQIGQNAVITLVSADVFNGIRVLTSQLMITVSPLYQNPSITCLHVDFLINATVSFVVPGKFTYMCISK